MELKKITSKSTDFDEAWDIIESSFPEDEKRSLLQQKEVFKKHNYSFIAVYDNNLVGIITVWHLDDFVFVEHFAVKEELRNRGYGIRILKELEKRYAKFIGEMEFPETEIQKKRAVLYQKAGLILNPYPYKQPPYGKDKNPVNCLIISYPEEIDETKFNSIRKLIHKEVYGLKEPLI
ncbi:MAG: GNAT family N-acetyltransferase [Nanoarchaeota archaeon]|nr:GNAT family N-acetyltransferase [Nanoarchaeota archaeon]